MCDVWVDNGINEKVQAPMWRSLLAYHRDEKVASHASHLLPWSWWSDAWFIKDKQAMSVFWCQCICIGFCGFKVDSHLQNVWWVAMGWETAYDLLSLTALSLVLMVTFKWNVFQNEQLILVLFITVRYYCYLAGYTRFLIHEWYSSRCILTGKCHVMSMYLLGIVQPCEICGAM